MARCVRRVYACVRVLLLAVESAMASGININNLQSTIYNNSGGAGIGIGIGIGIYTAVCTCNVCYITDT
jgi:hypothetical protein